MALPIGGRIGIALRSGENIYGSMDQGFTPGQACTNGLGTCPAGSDVMTCAFMLEYQCGTKYRGVWGSGYSCVLEYGAGTGVRVTRRLLQGVRREGTCEHCYRVDINLIPTPRATQRPARPGNALLSDCGTHANPVSKKERVRHCHSHIVFASDVRRIDAGCHRRRAVHLVALP